MPKKILLIICPPLWEKLPPAGVAYISQALEDAGHAVLIEDLNIAVIDRLGKETKKDWTVNRDHTRLDFVNGVFERFPELIGGLLMKIRDEAVDTVGFSVTLSNRTFCEKTAAMVKKEYPEIKIVFGGPEVFHMKIEGFRLSFPADHFIVGEGEKAVLDIMANDNPPKVIEFDQSATLPAFPKFNRFDLAKYSMKDALPVVASRGCFNQCAFCAERYLFKGYRFRAADKLFEEMKFLYDNRHTRHFVFTDSLFNGDLTNLEKWVDIVIASCLKFKWEAQIAVRNKMSDALLTKMRKSGCVNLFVGIESGSDGVLAKMKKGFTAYEALCFLHRLDHAGLQFEVSLIAHYPGETEGEFFQTLEFLSNNRLVIRKIAQVSLFRKYPGTDTEMPVGYNDTEGLAKIEKIIAVLKECGIPYTPSYINNLV